MPSDKKRSAVEAFDETNDQQSSSSKRPRRPKNHKKRVASEVGSDQPPIAVDAVIGGREEDKEVAGTSQPQSHKPIRRSKHSKKTVEGEVAPEEPLLPINAVIDGREKGEEVTKNARPRSHKRKRDAPENVGAPQGEDMETGRETVPDGTSGKQDGSKQDTEVGIDVPAELAKPESKAKNRPRRSRKPQKQNGADVDDDQGTNEPSTTMLTTPQIPAKVDGHSSGALQAQGTSVEALRQLAKRRGAENRVADQKANVDNASKSPRTKQQRKKDKRARKLSLMRGEDQKDKKGAKPATKEEKRNKQDKNAVRLDRFKSSASTADWTVSSSQGGLFIDQDPVLTQGAEYLILPTKSDVQIYAASTSLRVHSIQPNDRSGITSCTLSQRTPEQLLIACRGGSLFLWDWTTGKKLKQWRIEQRILQVMVLRAEEGVEDVLLLCENDENRTRSLFKCRISQSTAHLEPKLLLKEKVHSNIQVLADGQIIVSSVGNRVLIGYRASKGQEEVEEPYTWREVSVHDTVNSFDSCIQVNDKSKRRMPALRLVLGLSSGVIQIYDDILFKLIGKEKGIENNEIVARRLHWHRTAVNTVKWSKDQNYVISGGNETVLVIWQLDTNQKQFLPHLSTSILNLTISEIGSAYALRLGDNSVMVLSTADLLPATNIAGFSGCDSSVDRIVMDPSKTDHVLVAVPSDVVYRGRQPQRSFTVLQTFDASSNIQISKQAITRSLTTTVKVGPEGWVINEPNVTHLKITHDGRWLVTVDVWCPNERDLDGLYLKDETESRSQVVETILRFWSPDEGEHAWEPVTRINEPHLKHKKAVLDIAVNPVRVEVATIGSDGYVKLWAPRLRTRDGVAVKDQAGKQLMTWVCSQSIELSPATTGKTIGEEHAALVFSDDGSLLAASISSHECTHLIDVKSGAIRWSEKSLLGAGRASLAFAGTKLLHLSETLRIFDVIKTQVTFSLKLDSRFGNEHGDRILAVNRLGGTFAIGLNPQQKHGSAEVLIFSLENPENGPVHQEFVPRQISTIMTSPHTTGYMVIDKEARIRQLRPTSSIVRDVTKILPETTQLSKGLDSIFGPPQRMIEGVGDTAQGQERVSLATGSQTTGKRSLDEILRMQSSASAPPVAELFEQVATALSGSLVAA